MPLPKCISNYEAVTTKVSHQKTSCVYDVFTKSWLMSSSGAASLEDRFLTLALVTSVSIGCLALKIFWTSCSGLRKKAKKR